MTFTRYIRGEQESLGRFVAFILEGSVLTSERSGTTVHTRSSDSIPDVSCSREFCFVSSSRQPMCP